MKLTKKKAKELCIKKWEWIVNNNGKLKGVEMAIPELKQFERSNFCAYCYLYLNTSNESYECCAECPIRPNGFFGLEGCSSNGHLWSIWNEKPTKKNNKKIMTKSDQKKQKERLKKAILGKEISNRLSIILDNEPKDHELPESFIKQVINSLQINE